MDSRKADLVIKYNLHWKNAPKSSMKNRVNIVGMCDLSTSSRNLEQFKSYLLKNSGATGDDVKVSYIGDEDKEFPIETQEDFHTALNYFREVARSGNTITLKLESVFYKNKTDLLKRSVSSSEDSSRDVNEEHWYQVVDENVDLFSEPPTWFTKYMTKFKDDLVKEINNAVLKSVSGTIPKNTISTNTPPENAPVKQIRKKHKVKTNLMEMPSGSSMSKKKMKAGRSFVKASGDNIVAEKNALKEQKLDQKLAKLENKTLKIKAKKAMLQMKLGAESSRSSKHHHHYHNSNQQPTDTFAAEIENLMGAIPIRQRETTVPRMLGGQVLEHEWEVMNTGQLPWTAETELHYAWGSVALQPLHLTYSCPYLQPGEKGIVKVQLKIPKKPGKYENYWYFHHLGRRFGHWLGCQVVVDQSHLKTKQCSISNDTLNPFAENQTLKLKSDVSNLPKRDGFNSPTSFVDNLPPVDDPSFTALEISKLIDDLKGKICNSETIPDTTTNTNTLDNNKDINLKISDVNLNKQEKELLQKDILDIDTKLVDLKICNSDDISTTSDSDNQSIVSVTESNTTSGSEMSEEFVLVKKPIEIVEKESCEIDNEKNNNNNEANVDNKPRKSGSSFILEIPNDDSEVEDYIKINKTIIPLPVVRVQAEKKSDENGEQKMEEKKNEENEEVTDDQPKIENHSICKEGVDANKTNDPLERTCITVDGVQLLVPTKFLRQDFLNKIESTNSDNQTEATKENTTDPSETPKTNNAVPVKEENAVQEQTIPVKDDPDNARNTQSIYVSAATTPDLSLSSLQGNANSENGKSTIEEGDAKSNSNSNRLFVFPQSCPGFEVIYPPNSTDSFIGYSVDNSNGQATNPFQSDLIAWFSHNSGPGTPSSFYPVEHLPQTYSHSTSGAGYPNYTFQQQYSYPNYDQQMLFNGFPQYSHAASYNTNNATSANAFRTFVEEQQRSNFGNSTSFAEATASARTFHNSNVAEQPRVFSRTTSSASSFTAEENLERTSSLNSSNTQGADTSRVTTNNPVESPSGSSTPLQSPPISGRMREGIRNSGFKGILPVSVTAVPENIVTGAVNVASSAINTARSVLNMFNPEPGTWVNGHWVPRDLDSRRERALRILDEMGFRNRDYNATLLARYSDDITQVISELVQ
ncbi:uncharacterized protein LOC108734015 [Agrilus planipennis]|uniref:Uncharacterized protein LOC108734015 n=1 Tax=Agrilus planipennis TaxID=224129 RepID=A0A1W4WLH3_AGRPL|nr:uncharacterized protein LOC108734015 [Agrilus planipennis]